MLNKHDIAEYYSDPAVRRRILEAVYDKPVLVVQRRGDREILRKNNPAGGPININSAVGNANNPNDLAWFTDRRYSEFHPSIGKKTDTIWVDIDPGPERSTESLKPIVNQVVEAMKTQPGVKSTNITFSGGRGFHVRGVLDKEMDTDAARNSLNTSLKQLSIDNAVFSKPTGSEVRLDTSTLKNKGSLRAPYSINSQTGLVAVPLTERELRGFEPLHADVKTILRKKEFAPGIPRSRRTYALPSDEKDRVWTLAIQEHLARKAGKHWDLRLVDPATGYAHSWAIPKAQLPMPGGRPLLAVRTPTHTANYALNFGDKGPREISKGYGKGVVEIKHKEPVDIQKLKETSLRFTRKDGDKRETFALFKTKGDNWLFKNVSSTTKEGADMTPFAYGYAKALVKLGVAGSATPPERMTTQDEPISPNHPNLPADQFAEAIQSNPSDELDQREESQAQRKSPTGTNAIERRLNRPTVFDQTQEIPSEYMTGPTRMIWGGGVGGN